MIARYFACLLTIASLAGPATAAVVTPGNILVMDQTTSSIREFSTSGVFVQSFAVSPAAGAGSSDVPRDLVVDTIGNMHVFNGTFTPSLSTINQVTSAQVDRNGPGTGFASANATNRGGIAAIGSNVFVADAPIGARNEKGIIRFEAGNGFATTRFGTDFIANDLTFGADGRLYALGTESPAATASPGHINVYDPNSLARVDQIVLPSATQAMSLRGVAADGTGNMFAVIGTGSVLRLDASGAVVGSLSIIGANDLYDIDIDVNGNLLTTGTDSNVHLTNTGFTSQTSFLAAGSPSVPAPRMFATFATPVQAVPEPSTWIALLFCGAIACKRRRRVASV
ncbi:hypothetical protein Poly51_03660 [Rubripirellula tenax]|uniref:PEP-CTERM protein-sorting domain-containing protein n=1 Tax=Rubripirellula tenax TaxID=2528015 RepID=A0A5C6FK99_9BACT|nr:PEP-CTERM sorting domain-containing protein [Rubripirellula tenax]TWU60092.1 hypothetical protein Poly51_03660 [Rubripirellula tenax]